MPDPALGFKAHAFIEDNLSRLDRSMHDRDSDLRNVQLATVSPQGWPNLRTLILRGFARAPACAEMHSDARAGKVADIGHCSQVALLAWSARDRLQLRFTGTAQLHRGDAVARARWDGLSPNARIPYGLLAEAGRPVDDPAHQPHLPPQAAFQQFVVILVSLAGFDVLRLEPGGGQSRAAGRFTPDGLTAAWVGP